MFPCWICLSQHTFLPAEGSTTHFSEVYFEDSFIPGSITYELIIYGDSLQSIVLQKQKQAYPAFYSAFLDWNKTYFWKITAFNHQKEPLSTPNLHRFSLPAKVYSPDLVDLRIEVLKSDTIKHGGELLMLDYARGIFDRKGRLIWTVPELPVFVKDRNQIRDLRLSPDKTLTMLVGNVPIEMDFEGNILWRAPKPFMIGTDTITFHHDFKKNKNGHYFVLGHRKIFRKITSVLSLDTIKDETVKKIGDTIYKRTNHSLLLELDKNKNLVWFWDSDRYISDIDLNYKKRSNGIPTFGTHANAFSINEKGTKAFVGFRDLSRIVRIDYKTKKVEFSYGEKYPSGDAQCVTEFRGQHDATITNRNTLLVFNNNNANDERIPVGTGSILEYKDVNSCSENPQVWKFDLKFDSLMNGISSAAGNVDEFPNGNFLVCGGGLPRVFEVTKQKEVVWDGLIKGFSRSDSTWIAFPQYRTHWLLQLYRYHFLLNTTQQKNGLAITIINTGTADDVYQVELINSTGKLSAVKKTKRIPPGKSIQMELPMPDSSEFHLVVTPLSKRTSKKELNLSN